MASARMVYEWDHTAAMIAAFVNANPFRSKSSAVAEPIDFHPLRRDQRKQADAIPADIDVLSVFVPNKPGTPSKPRKGTAGGTDGHAES